MKNKSKPKKKNIPQYFQKKTSASLSQIIKIGVYKKRVNDLVRNNRRLAVELQEARCEVSSQSKVLKEYYTRDSNNIRRAQVKIRDIVQTINTLVYDIDEVKQFLDIDWKAIEGKIFNNRYTSDAKIIKAPEFEGIEEVSISVPEPPILSAEELSSSSQPSRSITERISMHKSYDQKTILSDTRKSRPSNDSNCIRRSNEVISPVVEHEMPPVLFSEESGDQNKNTRSTKSTKENSDGSLTPEFDIDLTIYKRKKSSSRRRTTLFQSSTSKTSKSNERAVSYEQVDPIEIECETRLTDSSVIQENKISPIQHTKCQEQSENGKSLTDSSPEASCISKNLAKCANEKFASSAVFSLQNASSVLPKVVPQQIEYNHTLLLNEDMEFTDIINSCDPLFVGKNTSAAVNPDIDERVVPDTCTEDEKNEIAKEENVNIEALKLKEENISISTADKQQIFSPKKIPFQADITPNQSNKRNRKSAQKDSLSPFYGVRRCRNKVKYLVFSSDDTDSDYTPYKQTVKKRKCKDRETSIFVPDAASKKTVAENIEDCFIKQKLSFQNEDKEKSDDLSVFSFNASFSEKSDNHVKQKKSKLSRNKKSDKGKDMPAKPLSQACSVTKLKGFTLKFSKNAGKKNKSENIVLPKDPEVPSGSDGSTSSSCEIEKEILTIENNVNKDKSPSSNINTPKDEMSFENKCNISLTDFGSLLSPRTILKNRNLNKGKKSEAKRVSFNASDLVCNFTKTSLSKTIAHNTKVWQTSRSVVDLGGNLPPFEKNAECNKMTLNGILSDRNVSDACVNAQESLSDSEETEIYNFPRPLMDASPMFADVKDFSFSPKKVYSSNELQNNKSVPDLGKHKSDEIDVSIENTNKIKTVSSDGKGILSQRNVKKKSCKSKKSIQMKSPTPPALKIRNHIETLQKKHYSSSKENVENNPKINRVNKHRNSKILEMLTFNDSCLSETTVDNNCLSNKGSKVSVDKNTLTERNKILSAEKPKKKNSGKKYVQSTPVLKDTMNLDMSIAPKTSVEQQIPKISVEQQIPKTSVEQQIEGLLEKETSLELPKRRSKPISYKEPSLNKKMRRAT